MDYLMTCTSEELALLVTVNGYPSVAKTIAEASFGKKSEKEWQAIMEAAVHQLIQKQLWDEEKDANGESPISVEVQEFIRSYVESKWMIRCSNQAKSNILMLHHIEGSTWMTHVIDRDIIHEFAYIHREEIPAIVRDYYSFSDAPLEKRLEFNLTDKAFDLLSKPGKEKKVRKMCRFTAEEEEGFEQFVSDLQAEDWSLFNISFFQLEGLEADPYLENIVFFLPSKQGIWLIEYSDHAVKPVKIQLSTHEEWCDLLDGVGMAAANVE
ncbi:hypothetical protein [Bacillus salipaludis]|uniref:Uncharacterized protein n=1 Tax=Bacillus salipaludis TaxID=2547811 RepID=A0AA90R1W1_9BACI|nr:hypothetical protein [Bacillus salipaludis]MDQ6595106.1 hypothetical protein [Bacillus salipaludis]